MEREELHITGGSSGTCLPLDLVGTVSERCIGASVAAYLDTVFIVAEQYE